MGQTVTVHIDDEIAKDPEVFKRIQNNLQKVFDRINAGAENLSRDQIESMHSQNTIYVSNNVMLGTMGGTFNMPQLTAENPNLDKLTADVIHDSRHSEQMARGLSFDDYTMIPMEMEASQFAVDVMKDMGGFGASTVEFYQKMALTGHIRAGSTMKDKANDNSRKKVFETMQRPQKPRK